MSLDRTRPNETRKPEFQELPDGRKRLTRYFELPNGTNLTDALVEAWGTVDAGPATGTTAGFAGLRLVDQRLDKVNEVSFTIKVYEELPESAEQQVGANTVIKLDDGRTAIEAQFLQFSSASATPGTVGTTTAPGDSLAYLQREEVANDGALRRIKRTYVYAGTLSTDDEELQGGALLKKTIVTAKTAPSTPSGYTLVGTPTQNPNGLPIYTYTYYKGTGQVSQDDDTKNNGALLLRTIRHLTVPGTLGTPGTNPITTPSGYTLVSESYQEAEGHRVWTGNYAKGTGQLSQDDDTKNNGALLLRTIRHLTVPGTLGTPGSNPITTPSGYTLVSESYQEAEGHRVWTANYAQGTGQLSQDDDTKHNGALLLRTIRHLTVPGTLGTAGSSPISTPATYTLVSQNYQEADGHRIWTATFAKGSGEISRDIDYAQSTDQGTTGITRTTIRYLVAPSATIQPTTLSGSVLVGQSVSEQDGHRVWTTQWAKGTGTVTSTNTTREGGNLIIYRRTALGSAPSAPAATRGGTVAIVDALSRTENGITVYDYTWAEGNGEVSRQTQIDKLGNLFTYTIRHLTAFTVTSNPTSVSGATVIGSTFTDQDGYRLWVVVWRKTISSTAQSVTQTQPDGSIIYTVTDYTDSSATPAYPGSGTAYLVKLTEEMNDGYIVTTAVYHKPPADYDFPKTISFTMPGLATAGNPPLLDPPVTKKLKATFYVSFSTTQNTETPYTVNTWSQLRESYLPVGSFLYQGTLRALDGYLGDSSSTSSIATTYRGISVAAWSNTVTASSPTARPTGVTVIDTDCEIYLTTTAGVKLYRNVSVKYTF